MCCSISTVVYSATALILIWVPLLSASVIGVRQYHGKSVGCTYSGGPINFVKTCGTSGYGYVFTGTVKSAVQVSDTDETVEFVPDEIFLGNFSGPITVRATEACLDDEIRVGDRWLVYAYKPPQDNSLILAYNSPSKPLDKAERSVTLLRRLGALQNSGIVTGRVLREIWTKDHWSFLPVKGRTVVAKRADGTEFTGVTDAEGYYEFEVPPDSYQLSANTERTLWAPEVKTILQNKSCQDVNFLLHNDPRYSDEKKK